VQKRKRTKEQRCGEHSTDGALSSGQEAEAKEELAATASCAAAERSGRPSHTTAGSGAISYAGLANDYFA
jgi:hypothetical protein